MKSQYIIVTSEGDDNILIIYDYATNDNCNIDYLTISLTKYKQFIINSHNNIKVKDIPKYIYTCLTS